MKVIITLGLLNMTIELPGMELRSIFVCTVTGLSYDDVNSSDVVM